MSFSRRNKTAGIAAGAAVFALTLAACSGGGDTDTSASGSTDGGSGDEPVTLTLATFNQFGYSGSSEGGDYMYDLVAEYEELHPNVTITYNVADTSNTARENFFTKLGPGGLADVEAIELDWLPEAMQYSDLLADLTDPATDGNWLDWKSAAATDADGRLIGYGTDIGPEAICYNVDAFEAAGLPTDPAEVAAALDGGWDKFFELGQQYTDATGKGFYEENAAVLQGMIGQIEAPYEDPETDEIIALDNPEIKAMYDQITAASEAGVSAGLGQWGDDWAAGMANGDFAAVLCPAWFLGVIEGNAPDGNWNIANAFPNGGGNWGGSYLTVPAGGDNVEAAKEFAAWLTAPEQQAKAFENVGAFPSSPEAAASDAVQSYTRAYFNDAPAGEIYTERAAAVSVTPYKGPNYFNVNDAMVNALRRVDEGIMSPEESWAQFEADVQSIG
ncbi:ABC transporter substrate-binding protein [Demequina zhanjiangensis]|uniref:Extracellular solute-binding protein n=1 Tax=Demequina zhanjiangensis TaxID=3051659 RepID=A0ABT8FY33_9MICO|nr:extracellular solute-binding protein [Demequina sp. SYSU T00b26]MDN4471810.1 extracellular solute-binding protein [Demequina sp. SYSU T00b26]